MTRYRCVADRKAEGFPVTAACEAADVSTSAFYAWRNTPEGPSEGEWEEALLVNTLREIHADDDSCGAPRMTRELARRGCRVNHKRIERVMREHGIVGYRPRKRRSLTKQDEEAAPAPDLVGRLFDPDRINHTWAGDITYIPTDEGWLYLATVLDLASRRLVGWSMDVTPDAQLVCTAVAEAVACRGCSKMPETIFHSDRGTQYTSSTFQRACTRLGLRQSMGRTGSCLDNAVAESFFATLKVELVNRHRYRTRAEARASIFAWIHRYNRRRLHSTIGYMPPVEWEQKYAEAVSPSSPMAA